MDKQKCTDTDLCNTTKKWLEELAVPVPLVSAVLSDTTTIWYGNSGGQQ